MNRFYAFAVHFGVSALVLAIFFAAVFFIWYPAPYFHIEGTHTVILILIGVDLIIGPLLTLVIFKPGKPGLKFDLSLIAAVQIVALLYGADTIYSERPYFTVFSDNYFRVIQASEIDNLRMDLLDPKIDDHHLGPTYVYIDKAAHATFKLFDNVVRNGPKLEHRPEYYKELKTNISESFGLGMDIEKLAAKSPDNKRIIDAFRARNPDMDKFVFYPLQGKHRFVILVLNRSDAKVIDYIDIDPWQSTTTDNPS